MYIQYMYTHYTKSENTHIFVNHLKFISGIDNFFGLKKIALFNLLSLAIFMDRI